MAVPVGLQSWRQEARIFVCLLPDSMGVLYQPEFMMKQVEYDGKNDLRGDDPISEIC